MARSEMTKSPSRRVSEEAAATPADIRVAIEALTSADWTRLRNYASNRIHILGPKTDGRNREDLLQITLELLLDDTRRWDRTKVEFVPFMIWAMKSISSNWARGYKPEETLSLELDAEKTVRRSGRSIMWKMKTRTRNNGSSTRSSFKPLPGG